MLCKHIIALSLARSYFCGYWYDDDSNKAKLGGEWSKFKISRRGVLKIRDGIFVSTWLQQRDCSVVERIEDIYQSEGVRWLWEDKDEDRYHIF